MATKAQKEAERAARTKEVIDHYRGMNNEWYMLKGLLCATHHMDHEDANKFYALFDTVAIAARMDEIIIGT